MVVTIRLNEDEEKQLNEMKQETGLSTTELVKKYVFDNKASNLGKISTAVNLAEQAINDEKMDLALEQIHNIHQGVAALWENIER